MLTVVVDIDIVGGGVWLLAGPVHDVEVAVHKGALPVGQAVQLV